MVTKLKTQKLEVRKSIWSYYSDDLQLDDIDIELTKIDAKNFWVQLKSYLPVYALFQSNRKK